MLDQNLKQKLIQVMTPILDREQVELYDLDLVNESGRRTLRVSISKKEGTVSVDDCYRVSHGISLQLDVEDIVTFSYDLEVSSPGIERSLRELWHFERAIGELIKVTLTHSMPLIENSSKMIRSFQGNLVSVENEILKFKIEDQNSLSADIQIKFDQIEKAKVVFLYGRDKIETKKGPKKKGK